MRLVMIDNYDSFTYNLVQLFYEFDLEVLVFRHDAITLQEIEALKPRWLCISPGPKAPAQAGISKEVIARFQQDIPILGVCLGHQALNEVWGGVTVRAPLPMHGKISEVHHQGLGLFAGLPSPLRPAVMALKVWARMPNSSLLDTGSPSSSASRRVESQYSNGAVP